MRSFCRILSVVVLVLFCSHCLRAESIDGGVIQMRLPNEDVTLFYIEAKGGMTVALRADTASVEGRKFYLGDGKVAVELKADPTKGILFQGSTLLDQGFKFKKGAVVKVQPGYKKATDLVPGDIYVMLPAVTFDVPNK